MVFYWTFACDAENTPAQDVDDLIYGDTPAPPSDRVVSYIIPH